jgi:hypothetical protein
MIAKAPHFAARILLLDHSHRRRIVFTGSMTRAQMIGRRLGLVVAEPTFGRLRMLEGHEEQRDCQKRFHQAPFRSLSCIASACVRPANSNRCATDDAL